MAPRALAPRLYLIASTSSILQGASSTLTNIIATISKQA